jgi:galactonate dehydratase
MTNMMFVKVMTDEGIYGVGEATVEGQVKAVEQCVSVLFQRDVLGCDPTDINKIWQKMYRHGFWKGGYVHMTAVSAIDQALWDINGKIYNVPVYKLLGGAVRDKIKTYSHAFDVKMAEDVVKKGFAGVKTGEGKTMGVYDPIPNISFFKERLRDIRSAIGDDHVICIDNHGRATPDVAIRLMEAAKPYDIYFFEEPIPPENSKAYKRIREAAPDMTIAAGERLFSRFEYREVIEGQLLDAVQPDICHCGGITEIMKIAAMAETYHIKFDPHNPNGPVSTAASLHAAAAAQNFDILECASNSIYGLDDVFQFGLKPKDGYFSLPEGPGLGIDFDEKAMEKYPYEFKQYAPNYAVDGSVAEI